MLKNAVRKIQEQLGGRGVICDDQDGEMLYFFEKVKGNTLWSVSVLKNGNIVLEREYGSVTFKYVYPVEGDDFSFSYQDSKAPLGSLQATCSFRKAGDVSTLRFGNIQIDTNLTNGKKTIKKVIPPSRYEHEKVALTAVVLKNGSLDRINVDMRLYNDNGEVDKAIRAVFLHGNELKMASKDKDGHVEKAIASTGSESADAVLKNLLFNFDKEDSYPVIYDSLFSHTSCRNLENDFCETLNHTSGEQILPEVRSRVKKYLNTQWTKKKEKPKKSMRKVNQKK